MNEYYRLKSGEVLDADKLTRSFQNVMRSNLAHGKGVVSGCEISPGSKPGFVSIAPGEFMAQCHDEIHRTFEFEIGKKADGFLWIQADDDVDNDPLAEIQGSDADPGSLWVCLGKVTSDAKGKVTTTTEGRKSFGWKVSGAP